MILAHHKFNNSKKTKKLAPALLADGNFTCQDYEKVTKQYIFTNLNIANIFLIA